MDEAVARVWAEVQAETEQKGRPLPIIDSLIAATALAHNLIIVTRNHPDMEAAGVSLLNPWSS